MRRALAILAAAGVLACRPSAAPSSPSSQSDWRRDWAVRPGFSLTLDTEGYELPTAIVFVPEPGSRPKDPLYFVTELRGRVRVITNDRTVHTFAENFFSLRPPEELPASAGEVGLAGICLAPEWGYLYVTFAYQDTDGILRNNIVRFHSTPRTFSLAPDSQVAFTSVFSGDVSSPSHQIGPCQVRDDALLVGVGDGEQPSQSQNLHSLLGKILRLTLDGKPAPGNPFRQDESSTAAPEYVWAYGLRNPFSFKAVGDRFFVADNGPDLDRFLEIAAGGNYLWDGSDWSAGTYAQVALAPAVAPVQLDYYPIGGPLLPAEYQQSFFMASAGEMRHPEEAKLPGVLSLRYDPTRSTLLGVPERFLGYRGTAHQMVTGLAFGPDGLYVVPLFPVSEGRSAVLKVRYDPAKEHPVILGRNEPAVELMRRKGCFGCHTMAEAGAGGSVGPRLDRDSLMIRLVARLHSDAYQKSLQEVDRLDAEPFRSYREARREVLEAQGLDRVHRWLSFRVREPRFDNAFSQMPNLGLSEEEASAIADFLLKENDAEPDTAGVAFWQRLPAPRHRYTALAFVVGLVFAIPLRHLLERYRTRRRRRAGAGGVQG